MGIDEHGNGCQSSPAGLGGNDTFGGSVIAIGLTADQSPNGKLTRHRLDADGDFEIGNLDDGRGYYVVGANGSTFQLSHTLGGTAINLTDGGGYPHIFRVEGLDLTGAGSGEQRLVLQLSAGTGPQKLDGIGGPSGAASSSDGVISATAAGGGGGAINVSTASSDATTTLVISATVEANAHVKGRDVTVTTHGTALAKGVAGNAGGGAISIGDSAARAKTTVTNTDRRSPRAQRSTASRNIVIAANSDLRPRVYANTQQGGFVGGSFGSTTAWAAYDTRTVTTGTLRGGNRVAVESHTSVDGFADSIADVGGLGASAETEANVYVGIGDDKADTTTEAGGVITARHVRIGAFVDKMKAYAHTKTYAIALGADSDADSEIAIEGYTRTYLLAGLQLTGHVDTAILAEWLGVDRTPMRSPSATAAAAPPTRTPASSRSTTSSATMLTSRRPCRPR